MTISIDSFWSAVAAIVGVFFLAVLTEFGRITARNMNERHEGAGRRRVARLVAAVAGWLDPYHRVEGLQDVSDAQASGEDGLDLALSWMFSLLRTSTSGIATAATVHWRLAVAAPGRLLELFQLRVSRLGRSVASLATNLMLAIARTGSLIWRILLFPYVVAMFVLQVAIFFGMFGVGFVLVLLNAVVPFPDRMHARLDIVFCDLHEGAARRTARAWVIASLPEVLFSEYRGFFLAESADGGRRPSIASIVDKRTQAVLSERSPWLEF